MLVWNKSLGVIGELSERGLDVKHDFGRYLPSWAGCFIYRDGLLPTSRWEPVTLDELIVLKLEGTL